MARPREAGSNESSSMSGPLAGGRRHMVRLPFPLTMKDGSRNYLLPGPAKRPSRHPLVWLAAEFRYLGWGREDMRRRFKRIRLA